MKPGFKIKPVTVRNGGFTYETFRLTGWTRDGLRVRKQFKSRDEAEGERDRLAMALANADGTIRPVNTRLSPAQIVEAESAFGRLGPRSLTEAVEWFLANYRPPQNEMALSLATAEFLKERAKHVRPVVLGDYAHTLKDLNAAFPEKKVHEVSTEDIQRFLDARNVGKKRFNNLRGELHALFVGAMSPHARDSPTTAQSFASLTTRAIASEEEGAGFLFSSPTGCIAQPETKNAAHETRAALESSLPMQNGQASGIKNKVKAQSKQKRLHRSG